MLHFPLTDGRIAGKRERVDVGRGLHVLDAAVSVLDPEADGVIQVGQVVGVVQDDLSFVVEAADVA